MSLLITDSENISFGGEVRRGRILKVKMATFSTVGYLYKFTLNNITKQRYLVQLVTTEMHFIFDTLIRTTQAFVRYLHLGAWDAEALPPKESKYQQSEIFQFSCLILHFN